MTAESEARRAWILGAGFSRSLGGPLLPDLLSLNARTEVRARYSDYPQLAGFDSVYWLYHYGSMFGEGVPFGKPMSGVRAWRDAEEFLERLSVAATNRIAAAKVLQLFRDLSTRYNEINRARLLDAEPEAEDLDTLGRRLVGAACCAFLEDVGPEAIGELERWRPYRDWFTRLGGSDALITFNYDRVVELLNEWSGTAGHGSPLTVVTDAEKASMVEFASQQGRGVALLKLHGSVDWRRRTSESAVERDEDPQCILKCHDSEISLATPGPSKVQIARELFSAIWKAACRALSSADEVYFLGFRFPPSDAEARTALLSALRTNRNRMLRVHVVLGEDDGHPDVRRMRALIEAVAKQAKREEIKTGSGMGAVKGFRVRVHPMRAEDFLTIWDEELSRRD